MGPSSDSGQTRIWSDPSCKAIPTTGVWRWMGEKWTSWAVEGWYRKNCCYKIFHARGRGVAKTIPLATQCSRCLYCLVLFVCKKLKSAEAGWREKGVYYKATGRSCGWELSYNSGRAWYPEGEVFFQTPCISYVFVSSSLPPTFPLCLLSFIPWVGES